MLYKPRPYEYPENPQEYGLMRWVPLFLLGALAGAFVGFLASLATGYWYPIPIGAALGLWASAMGGQPN